MYKIITLITVLSLGNLVSLSAQNRNPRFEQIKAHKIAYLTDIMDLSVAEAEVFWPIYNEYEEALEENRKDSRIVIRNPNEEESKDILNSMLERGEKDIDIKEKFYEKAAKVVSYRKLLLMTRGEREFRVKILERYKNANKRR